MTYGPVTTERRTTAAIVDVLAEAGVRHVFGMPGGYTGGIFSSLFEHPTIKVIQCREESVGSIAAEAYARLTGAPVVIMGQGEWIVGNAGQGTLEALLGAAPVLVLTEMSDGGPFSHHAPYQAGTGDYGNWDAVKALEGVTKRVMVARYPGQAVQQTQLAIKHALTGQPGPVAVVYELDSLKGTVDGSTEPAIYPTAGYLPRRSRSVDAEAVEAAAAALRGAKRPVIVAGNGVRLSQGYDSLLRLARTLDAPVATTASGKGVIVESDPLSLGTIGTFGNASAIAGVHEADAVIAIGTKLGPSDTGNQNRKLIDPSRQVIVQIDVEPLNTGWTFPVEHPLVGDADFLMQRLADACGEPAPRGGAERVLALRSQYDDYTDPAFHSDEVPFTPHRVVSMIQQAVPDDTIICCDAGENRLFMMHWFKATNPGGYLQPAAGGGMGYSIPAAIGAKVARPDQPVVAVLGDGSFAMSLHALMTAVQERLPIGVVVFNNTALGWVLHGMGKRAVAATFDEADHAAIARSLGCDGVRPTTIGELQDALKHCANPGDRPFVVDVPISLATSFNDIEQFGRIAD